MTHPPLVDPVRIGRAVVDPRARKLLVDGRPARVGSRAFDVLMLLVAERDRVVTKDEILQAVWPNLVVEENNLQVQVAALRRALGPEAIVTVSGRGYRLGVPVHEVEATAPLAAADHAAASTSAPAPAPTAPTPRPEPVAALIGNLPRPASPLVGRGAELMRGEALLAGAALLTLTGPGGIGKTRLALELARRSAGPRFADGVWFVELAALGDAADLVPAVAQVLGLTGRASASATSLADALAMRALLLVLDNCEHLREPVAALATALLAAAPGLRLIATTQQPLHVEGECLFAIGGLALPAQAGLDAARASGAVALFVQRASAAMPGFRLDADSATPVADICRRLDGVALAIEMAAARVPLLGVQGVRERLGRSLDATLTATATATATTAGGGMAIDANASNETNPVRDERLRMLTTGAHDADARHRTLRATLEWSLNLLEPGERRLLRRLGVFPGSFGLAAVRAVVGDTAVAAAAATATAPAVASTAATATATAAAAAATGSSAGPALGRAGTAEDDWTLLDRLGRLVEKSLVVSDGAGLPRFRLLESVAAIAVEEAQAAGEWEALRRSHAAWVRAHFARADADHVELSNEHWLARYRPELDHLRAALRHAAGPGADPETAAALAGSSVSCWFLVGLEAEALRTMELTRPFVDESLDAAVAAQWWLGVAMLSLRRVLPAAQALDACDRALALFARLADRRQQYKLWCMRAYLCANAGDGEAARAAIEEACKHEDPAWPPNVLVNRLQAESALHTMSGALDLYLEAERRAARLYAAAGKAASELVALSNVADAQLALGDAAAALGTVREVIVRRRALKLAPTAASMHVLCGALIALGELEQARRAVADALPLARGSGMLADLLDHVALMLALEGRARDAARVAGRADAAVAERGFPRQPAEARSRERVGALLEVALGVAAIEALLKDGAAMTEEGAAALADQERT